MAKVYENARLKFFTLEPDASIVITGKPKELVKFRDSIYKLSKRYKAYGKLYKTKLLTPKKLQIWRIK
jgi:hypothetical protein